MESGEWMNGLRSERYWIQIDLFWNFYNYRTQKMLAWGKLTDF